MAYGLTEKDFKNVYKSPRWFQLRQYALRRDQFVCVICNVSVRGKGKARIDHIIPVKENIELAFELSNLRTLCPSCDNKRHSEKRSGKEYQRISIDGFADGW